jgi:bacterioferritin
MASRKPFASDIENIRKRARKDIEKGAITFGYSADRLTVIKLLNHALATELVCVLRYKYHYYMATGIHSQSVKAELVAERIAIDSYREIIQYVGNDDPTTRRMLEGILAMEEEHAEDMNTLLEELGKKGEPARKSTGASGARKAR